MENKRCDFYPELYIGKGVREPERVRRQLEEGGGGAFVYCVIRTDETSGMLTVINSAFLRQPYYRNKKIYVYGIAVSFEEARDLIVRMSDDACAAGMDGNIKAYLDERIKKI